MAGKHRVRAAFASAVLALGGCVEIEVRVVVGPGGEGTHRLDLRLAESAIARVERTAPAVAAARENDPLRVFDRATVEADLESRGLELLHHAVERRAGRRDLSVAARCDSFAELRSSPLLGPRAEWFVLPGRNPGNVRIVFYPEGHERWRAAREQADAMRTKPDPVRAEFFRVRQRTLADFSARFTLCLPGDVDYTSPNLVRRGAREVEAVIAGDSLTTPEDLVLALAPRFEVEFDATGCDLPLDREDPAFAGSDAR